ncbi:MAG TPA: hypothetical protein VIG99_08560 [Myxococcaceae bacterium]|jgi:hypothetical protein
MRSSLRLAFAAAITLSAAAPSVAMAQRSHVSAFGGEPLPQGTNLLHAQFGWPGLSATFLTGATPKGSFGGRFTFNYGFEGLITGVNLGLKFQGLVRLGLIDNARVNLGLELAPGLALYFPGGGAVTQVGITVPVAFILGIPVSDALAVHVILEVPSLVTFTGYSTFYIPIYMGGGLEYALDKSLMLTLALRMGPMIDARIGRSNLGMEALFGLAFRL